MNIVNIAKIAYEVNRIYRIEIGDDSQLSWKDAPEWQKKSVINGVSYHLDNLDSKPEDSHNSWLKEKEKDGWSYGKVKDAEKKTHPCYVPYEELPLEDKIKDSLFISVVKDLSILLD